MNTISRRVLEPFLQKYANGSNARGGIVFIMNTTPDEIIHHTAPTPWCREYDGPGGVLTILTSEDEEHCYTR